MKIKFFALISVLFFVSEVSSVKGCVLSQIQDSIKYMPFTSASGLTIVVKATFDSNKSGDFILDSGGGITLVIDSSFFYENVDATNLVQVIPRGNMYYWRTYYEGDINVSIGYHQFKVSRIEVRSWTTPHDGDENIKGIIGEAAFLNKITVINMEKSEIAFVDSIIVDSTYHAIPLHKPLNETKKHLKHQRYVQIGGFTDKKGNKKSGSFLFDTGNARTGIVLKTSFAANLDFSKNKVEHLVESGYYRWYQNVMIDNRFEATKVPIRRVSSKIFDEYERLVHGDGLLGMPLLQRYNIIADYKNDILYLQPIKNDIF